MKRSSLSSENWRMKFEISVKIYREEKYIRKRKFSSLKKIIRLLYDSSSPNHDFQFISFNLQFYLITLIIFRALEIPSSPLEEERKLVPIRSSHFFLPFFFFFFPFFFTSISNYSFWHISFFSF